MTLLSTPRNTTHYSLGRTTTFRAASAEVLNMFGTNLQNIEGSARVMYIADEGMALLQSDQSGAEALIVSYLCRAAKFRDLFIYGIKPHVYVALHMFKEEWKARAPHLDIDGICAYQIKDMKKHEQFKEIDKLIKSSDNWPASSRYYYLAKQTCHSANYGIKGPTFQMNVLEKSDGKVALTRKQADYFLSFYRTEFPEISEWNEETRRTVTSTRTLFNLFGHPRYFGGKQDDAFIREALAFVPQSTVGEITHMAYRDLQNYIEDNKLPWDLLQNNHDSYMCQCPFDGEEIKHCGTKMQEFLERDLVSHKREKFKMKSEIKIGFNWSNFDIVKNPMGLWDLVL